MTVLNELVILPEATRFVVAGDLIASTRVLDLKLHNVVEVEVRWLELDLTENRLSFLDLFKFIH